MYLTLLSKLYPLKPLNCKIFKLIVSDYPDICDATCQNKALLAEMSYCIIQQEGVLAFI